MQLCQCPRDALCDACLKQRFGECAGTAWSRGCAWADSVARRIRDHRPWPDTPRVRELAAQKVRDLAGDPRRIERLVDQVIAGAKQRWDSGAAADVARRSGPERRQRR